MTELPKIPLPKLPPLGRIDSCEVVQVIRVVFTRGRGTPEDPVRLVKAYYTLDGKPLAENDPQLEDAQ